MKKTVLKATLFALVVGNSCGSSAEDTNAASLLLKAPAVSGDSYRCEDMVRAVNALRRLGKAEAIAVLKGHLKDYDAFILPQEHEKILLVCRLLFSNPQGWATPGLGHPYPEVNCEYPTAP